MKSKDLARKLLSELRRTQDATPPRRWPSSGAGWSRSGSKAEEGSMEPMIARTEPASAA
jgi:hypothetical protein